MRADRRDPTIAALRKFKPSKFSITMRDGATKAVNLSTKQNRWELLSDTLEVLPWAVIEALDDSGAVLGAIEREHEEDDEDDDDGGSVIGEVERLAKIMLHVMVTTQQETRKMFADSQRIQGELTSRVMEAMHAVQESYSVAMKVQATALTGGAGGGEGEDNVMKMMQMALALNMGKPPITVPPQPPRPVPPPPKPKPKPPKPAAPPNGA